MKTAISVSAPGKLMLLGEHAVVHGYPCIVTAVNKRLTVTATKITGTKVHIDAPQVKETRFVDQAVATFFTRYHIQTKDQGIRLSVRSDFTHQVGFGSSSAVSVATIKALSVIYKTSLSNKDIFDLAYEVTLDIQGVGSGFDIAAATYGRTLYFRKGGTEIAELSDDLPLVVGYTGIKADTPSLVRQVNLLYQKNPQKITAVFEHIGGLVEKGRKVLEDKDWKMLGQLMDQNQEYLRELNVSSDRLETLIKAAKSGGAWGAKLSGAGGGDCMVAIVPEEKRRSVEHAISKTGGEVMRVETHAVGVFVELGGKTQTASDYFTVPQFFS